MAGIFDALSDRTTALKLTGTWITALPFLKLLSINNWWIPALGTRSDWTPVCNVRLREMQWKEGQ